MVRSADRVFLEHRQEINGGERDRGIARPDELDGSQSDGLPGAVPTVKHRLIINATATNHPKRDILAAIALFPAT